MSFYAVLILVIISVALYNFIGFFLIQNLGRYGVVQTPRALAVAFFLAITAIFYLAIFFSFLNVPWETLP